MLSNMFRPHADATSPPSPVECRPASAGEARRALQLVLGNTAGPATEAQVDDFLARQVQGRIDLQNLWVSARGVEVLWSTLAIPSPGRTVLLLVPDRPPAFGEIATNLLNAVTAAFAKQGFRMAQVLLEPSSSATATIASSSSGFTPLAELLYLQGEVMRVPAASDEFAWQPYDASRHAAFARVIQASYIDSLDCPALNGLRDIDDIIEGHKGAGGASAFDPSLWSLAIDPTGEAVGVLLLAPLAGTDIVELVYLGVPPVARGRRVGTALLRHAMAQARARGAGRLTLAVDSRNEPALRLYFAAGLRQFTSRVAYLRPL